jgi:hypothetical protein
MAFLDSSHLFDVIRTLTLRSIAQFRDARALGAMIAAEHTPIFFQAMADNAHSAMLARRCEQVNGALETVKGVGPAALSQFERFVVVIAASVALCHCILHLSVTGTRTRGLACGS